MRAIRLASVFLLFAAAFAQSAAPARRPVRIRDVMRLQGVSSAVLSPDGQWVLYTVSGWDPAPGAGKPAKERMRSHIGLVSATHPSGRGAARQITFGARGERDPQWSPDGRFISFLANRAPASPPGGAAAAAATAGTQLYVMRADGGEARPLTRGRGGAGAYAWSPDSRRIAFLRRQVLSPAADKMRRLGDDVAEYEGGFLQSHIWLVDVATGKQTQLTRGNAMTAKSAPVWSPDGTQIAFEAAPTPLLRDDRTNIYLLDVATKRLRPLTRGLSPTSAPAFSPDGRSLAYLMSPNPHQALGDGIPLGASYLTHLMLLNLATGRARDLSSPSFDLNAGAPVWLPGGKTILFSAGREVYRPLYAYSLATGRYTDLAPRALIEIRQHGAVSRDGARIVFLRQSATQPPDVYAAAPDMAAPRRLTTVNPQTARFALGAARAVNWKSADGRAVQGVLILPVGYQAGRRYPLLVNVHGGPTGAFSDGYNLYDQYWAGKGWAVLLPNPRGSTGYGLKFLRGNVLDWGGGDYRDIMAGVDALVARGIADPNRMAEWGWSYGGYMTCWIVSQTGRFKAAMMGAGLSDLVSMYGSTDIPGYLGGFFHGYPDAATRKLYRERSGLTYVGHVTTPLLILQGADDDRVPTGQSLEFFRALKDRGKTVRLFFYPREHHGFIEYDHILDRYHRIYDWLSHYTLGSGPALPPPPA
jgi:dipeptidyl aminopeptidase/acylaminoacyl peptidase